MNHFRESRAPTQEQGHKPADGTPLPPDGSPLLPDGSPLLPARRRHMAVDALEHPGILLALLVTVLALPLLVIGRMSTATAMPRTVQVSSVAGPTTMGHSASRPPSVVTPPGITTTTIEAPPSTTEPPAPPTTAQGPVAAAPATTAAPRPRPTPTTAAPMAAAPPATMAPRQAPAPSNSQSGGGTWYSFRSGTCAHKTLPFGTVVHITDTANGHTATCVVADRGPYAAGRILDMDPSVFQQLAPLSSGVIPIVITW